MTLANEVVEERMGQIGPIHAGRLVAYLDPGNPGDLAFHGAVVRDLVLTGLGDALQLVDPAAFRSEQVAALFLRAHHEIANGGPGVGGPQIERRNGRVRVGLVRDLGLGNLR